MTDRFGGRRTLLATQVAGGLISAVLAAREFAGVLSESWLIGAAILSGLCFTFALPARNVMVRRLVPEDMVMAAFVMDAVSYNLGRAIAPLVSIAIAYWVGFGWSFAGNAISFGVFTLILCKTRQMGAPEPTRESRIGDGFRIAINDGRIAILLLMVAAVTIADDPVLVLGPALANRVHVMTNLSGWFIAALGAGCVVGSLRRSRHLPSLRLAASALALLGGCMVLFVMTPWPWVSIMAALGAGIAGLIANSATRTLLSEAAAPEQLASVMAIWAIAWAGSKPIASVTDGLLAGWIGVRWTGVVLALPTLIPLVVLLFVPSLGTRLARFRRDPQQKPPDTGKPLPERTPP